MTVAVVFDGIGHVREVDHQHDVEGVGLVHRHLVNGDALINQDGNVVRVQKKQVEIILERRKQAALKKNHEQATEVNGKEIKVKALMMTINWTSQLINLEHRFNKLTITQPTI